MNKSMFVSMSWSVHLWTWLCFDSGSGGKSLFDFGADLDFLSEVSVFCFFSARLFGGFFILAPSLAGSFTVSDNLFCFFAYFKLSAGSLGTILLPSEVSIVAPLPIQAGAVWFFFIFLLHVLYYDIASSANVWSYSIYSVFSNSLSVLALSLSRYFGISSCTIFFLLVKSSRLCLLKTPYNYISQY